MNNSVDIQVFKDFKFIAAIADEWDMFMESISGEIFLSFDWCRIWWDHYGAGRKLIIFIFRDIDKNNIIGILPLYIDKIRILALTINAIKIIGTDFTPVAVRITVNKESIKDIFTAFMKYLNEICIWDIIYIGPICGREDLKGEIATHLNNIYGDIGYKVRLESRNVHTYIKIASSWEEQLASMTKKHRDEMKRKYDGVIKKGNNIYCIDATPESLNDMFDKFVEVHQSHWERLNKAGHFGAWPSSIDFHKDVMKEQYNKKRLMLYKIYVNDTCIGYRYAYRFGDTYYCFLYARNSMNNSNNYDFARIDFGELVKRASKENVRWIDSMRSEYQHKLQLGGELLPIYNLYIYNNSIIKRVSVNTLRIIALIANTIYYKIFRSRIAPRIGIKTGKLWLWWIRVYQLSY